MRPASAAELALLAGVDYQVSTRVLVEDAAGAFQDLCDLDGEDRVDEIEGGVSVDDHSATCTVTVAREVYERSLSPLRSDSPLNHDAGGAYAPLLALSRELQVIVATHASGTAPAPGDWKPVFVGRIHGYDLARGDNQVGVAAADFARRLARTRIKAAETYGSEEGTPVQAVMRAILDRWGFADVALDVPVDPEWMIRPYELAAGGFVLDALRTLAQGRGWDVRYRWSEAARAFRLTLFQLDPEPAAPVHTFTADDILAVRRLEVDDADLRNEAVVKFWNRSTGKRDEVTVGDPASVEDHGVLSMEFVEADASPVDTPEEARALGRAAVHALKAPNAEQEIDVRLFWPVELGDYVAFGANRWYDAPQLAAVSAIRWRIARSERITTITTRGKPVVAHREYLNRSKGEVAAEDYRILQARIVEDLEDAVVVEVVTTPAVDELAIFTQLVPTPYIGGTDPKVTGTARPGVVVADGGARITFPKASGKHLLLVSIVALDADLRERGSKELAVPAAEVRLGERVAAAVVDGTTDLTVSLGRPSASAFPVECEVYLEDTDGAPLVRHVFTADGPRAIGPTDYPELGGIPLPERRPLDVIAAFEAVDGSLRFARASPTRDPLPWGAPSTDDYRPDARIVLPYDPDTDAIYVRLGDGRVKTFTALVGGGSWVYIRGTTVLDDGSVEDVLRPGETSTPYVVEYEGGGARLVYFNAPLHGVAPQAPAARGFYDLVNNRSAAAAGADLESPIGEDVGLRVRFSADPDAPVYTLVSADNTALCLPSGSRVTPAALYDDGPGAPLAKLAAVQLRSGQIVHLEMQAYGRDSGVSGRWTPLPLSLMERARGGSLQGTYDPATGQITAEAIGGTHQQSALVLAADNEALAGAFTQVITLSEGAVQRPVFQVPAAKRQGTWHLRMVCNNGPVVAGAPSGLDGDALTARVVLPDPIPTVRKIVSQSGSTGHLSLEVTDLAGRRGAVRFKTHTGGGTYSFADPADGSWSEDPTAPYAASVAIDPKHGAWVAAAVAYTALDGVQRWLVETHHFDPDQFARVDNLVATFDASHQVLPSAGGDEDTDVIYFTVGVGAEPADPTTSAHNGFVVGRSGSINTGVVCAPGSAAVVKARGWNSVTGLAPAEMVKRIEARNSAVTVTPAPPFVTSARAKGTAGNTLCGSIVHTIYLSVSDASAASFGVVVEEWRIDAEDWQAVHVGVLPLTTTEVAHNVAGYRMSVTPDFMSRRSWTYRVRVVRTSDGGTASPPQSCASIEQLVEACP